MEQAQHCYYCRYMYIGTKVIKKPFSLRTGRARTEYIHVCSTCLVEHGLENEPEYELSDLRIFVENNQWNAVVPVLLETTDGDEYLAFSNGQGQFMSTKELKFIAESLLKTIEANGVDEYFKETNEYNSMASMFRRDPAAEGKFMLPLDYMGIRLKHFNVNKKWSFKCGNCTKKMSSIDGGDYFSISPGQIFHYLQSERACSKFCAKVIVKEYILNYIKENHYEKYFDLVNLDKNIESYIESL